MYEDDEPAFQAAQQLVMWHLYLYVTLFISVAMPKFCYDFDRFRLYSRDRSQSVSDNAQAYVQGAS